jgi:hypothetical protein
MSDQNRPPEDDDWGPSSPWQQQGPSGSIQPPPGYSQPPPSYQPPPGYNPQPPPGYGYPGGPPQSNTAQTLAIIGIVCILICSPAAIVLGLIAQNKYREQRAPDTLAKIAWIGGIASLVIGILYALGAAASV